MAISDKYEVYKNAPIILAIFQFRYQKIEEFDSKKIIATGNAIKKEYPNSNVSVLQMVKIDPASETKISLSNNEINGVRFESEDKLKVLTIAVDKFTFELHGKYPGWENVEKEVKSLWELFGPALTNLQIQGLSVRYTNRINIPVSTTDISKYFTTYLQTNAGDQIINQFQLRYTSVPEDKLIIHVGHILEPEINGSLPYIFDIDVIKLGEIPNDSKAIRKVFEELRERKNLVFKQGITEETRKIIR